MNTKAKGTNAERELIHKFWQTGKWTAIRIAGSGSNHYPCPDILAGNNLRKIALECKATSSNRQYFEQKQIEALQVYCSMFGAEAWVGVKFERKEWVFFSVEDLKETEGSNFVLSEKHGDSIGLSFEDMTR